MGAISRNGEDLETLAAKNDHLGVLRHIRLHKLRNPEMVLKHGKSFLGKETPPDINTRPSILSAIGSMFGLTIDEAEKLSVLEQMVVAAVDVNDIEFSETCLIALKKCLKHYNARAEQPLDEKTRFRRLMGLILEAKGESDSANALYDILLEENPSNSYALRRKYCIMKSQSRNNSNNEVSMREALNDYLECNLGDATAWLEMSDLCLNIGDYRGAAYCYEEIILCNPLDASLHCKLGEIYVTIGGINNLRLARKHLSQSLVLSPAPGNLRAVYSLFSAAELFVDEADSKGKKNAVDEDEIDVAKELLRFASENLINIYNSTEMSKIVSKVVAIDK